MSPLLQTPEGARLVAALRELRARTGLSLVALAGRTTYSKSSWERYLNGKKLPPRDAVEALCRVAGEPPGRCVALWELADLAWSGRADRAAPADPAAPAPPEPPEPPESAEHPEHPEPLVARPSPGYPQLDERHLQDLLASGFRVFVRRCHSPSRCPWLTSGSLKGLVRLVGLGSGQ